MRRSFSGSRGLFCALTLLVMAFGCAGPSGSPAGRSGSEPAANQRTAGPKRLTTAILGDLNTFSYLINLGIGSIRGVDEVEKLVHAGLTIIDGKTGEMAPRLAEAVPTLENGGWRLQTDGRMETTWRIRDNVRWHDGTPLTTADLVFTTMTGQDRDLPSLGSPGYKAIDRVEAVDDRTILVSWKQPYIEADRMFSAEFAMPLPKHLLERAYQEDKADFTQEPYFSQDFIGAGPFRIKEFVRSSHVVLVPYEEYVLGRPKLDEIVVRFMSDPNTVIANVLAGEVLLTLGRGLSLEQSMQVAVTWQAGKMQSKASNWIAHHPQHLTPNPAVIGNPQFRRALLYGLDREGMSDALQGGQATVAHAPLVSTEPEYREVESSIVKYGFDARRAGQIVESLGYTRGSDGFYRDEAGQRLSVEARTNAGDDLKDKLLFSTVDYWQRAGIGAESYIVPRQIATDRELRSTYPGFDLVRQPFDPLRYTTAEAAVPASRFLGNNRGRYMNAELDELVDRYYVTIARQTRMQVLGQLLHHMSDNAVILGTIYGQEPILVSDRLINVNVAQPQRAVDSWNAHEWDIR